MPRHRRRLPPMYRTYRCSAAGASSGPVRVDGVPSVIDWSPSVPYAIGDIVRIDDLERMRERDRKARARRRFRQAHRVRRSKGRG